MNRRQLLQAMLAAPIVGAPARKTYVFMDGFGVEPTLWYSRVVDDATWPEPLPDPSFAWRADGTAS